jgi:YD repeat-containing protein
MRFTFACSLLASVSIRPAFALDFDPVDLRAVVQASATQSWDAPRVLEPHLTTVEAEGGAVVSVPLELPPAILAPRLALTYSSMTGVSREVAFGWTVNGILQIERPTARAFDQGFGNQGDGEYLLSGDGVSGILLNVGGSPGAEHILRSNVPNQTVWATYDSGFQAWDVDSSSGDHWFLRSIGPGYGLVVEPGWWRVTEKVDRYGNRIDYSYDDYGRIETITYGGNNDTSSLPTTLIEFIYPQSPYLTRYDGRKGALDDLHPELEEIRISVGSPAKWEPVSTYQIESDFDNEYGVVRIDSIRRIGMDPVEDPIAAPGYEFEYDAELNSTGGSTLELGDTFEHTFYNFYDESLTTTNALAYGTEEATEENETCISSGFFDLNGDGIKEFVIRDDGEWEIHQGKPTENGAEWSYV